MGHTYNAETYKAAKKEIWKITGILTVLTIVELILGFWMYFKKDSLGGGGIMFIKGTILILMIVKAFYIVAYFMHLKHEIRNMVMTIVVPLSLFIWFIISFLKDGASYSNLRNTYDKHYEEQRHIKVEEKHHGAAAETHKAESHTETAPAEHH